MEFVREKGNLRNNRRKVFTKKKWAEMGGQNNYDNGHCTYGVQEGGTNDRLLFCMGVKLGRSHCGRNVG